jgi:RNA polymerase sigma-70 factor (ECF subfamily)
VADAFLAAARGGDFASLVALLDSEVTLTADALSTPAGRPLEVRGAESVARGALASSTRAGLSELALVDGAVGVVYAPAGHLQLVLALTVGAESRITAIELIADPDRLRHLDFALLPD